MMQDSSLATITAGENLQLLNLVPPDAGLVVEIGSEDNHHAAIFNRRNPRGKYISIKTGPATGCVSDQQLDDSGIKKRSVNCLVLHGEALNKDELHLHLQQLTNLLTDDGLVLATIANSMYWSLIKDRCRGNSHESDDDLSVNENNPAYTLEEIRDLVRNAGLIIQDIRGTGGDAEGYKQFLGSVPELMNSNAVDSEKFIKHSRHEFFIVRAIRSQPSIRFLIRSMTLKPVGALNDVRIHEPEILLSTIPGVRTISTQGSASIDKAIPGEQRVFIWQRPIMVRPGSLVMLRRLIQAGYLVIVEFDDDPRRWQKIIDNDYLTFRGVHGVQTSTDVLAEFLRQYNPNVKVFPNQVLELPEKKTSSDDGVVRIFFGALNREEDWRPLMPALNRVLEDSGASLQVTVIHDKDFFDELITENKTYTPTCNYQHYQRLLTRCDIGLLPLEPTEFNRYKSDLKYLEHAAHGVVALASPVVYDTAIKDNETGVLFYNVNEFEEKLRYLINEAEFRSKIADNAYQWVARHRLLGQHYYERYDWYKMMLSELPQFNKQLKQRVPELFSG